MQTKRRLTLILTLLLFLLIIALINLIFLKLNCNIDLTENRLYSVSGEAKSVAGDIKREIKVYYFTADEERADVIGEFTRRFCAVSDKLSFKTVDPVKHPEIANRYAAGGREITDKTVVFDNGESYKIVPYEEMFSYNYLTGQNNLFVAEERYCLALTALNKDGLAEIGFLTGHGETADESLKVRIEDFGAKVSVVDIRNENLMGFDVIFIISPKTDFTASELTRLDTFLKGGGTVLVAPDASAGRFEMLESFLGEWGISVGRDMVLSGDAGSTMGNLPYSVIGSLKPHQITDGLIKNNIRPVFFASESITPLWEAHGGIKVTVLAETSGNASAVSLDEDGKEENGVFALLTLSEGEKGRLFTFGSNMFFSDELKAYNGDLLRNIITFASGGEPVRNIAPKPVESSSIKVPKSDIMFYIVIFGVIIPALIAVLGIIIGIRRKRL